jgi:hypothetical protein
MDREKEEKERREGIPVLLWLASLLYHPRVQVLLLQTCEKRRRGGRGRRKRSKRGGREGEERKRGGCTLMYCSRRWRASGRSGREGRAVTRVIGHYVFGLLWR